MTNKDIIKIIKLPTEIVKELQIWKNDCDKIKKT